VRCKIKASKTTARKGLIVVRTKKTFRHELLIQILFIVSFHCLIKYLLNLLHSKHILYQRVHTNTHVHTSTRTHTMKETYAHILYISCSFCRKKSSCKTVPRFSLLRFRSIFSRFAYSTIEM